MPQEVEIENVSEDWNTESQYFGKVSSTFDEAHENIKTSFA